MANKHGSLSIDSENLFPIIKKWLYSDHDIFYRELISNGCDAITKLKKLDILKGRFILAMYSVMINRSLNYKTSKKLMQLKNKIFNIRFTKTNKFNII